MIRTMIVAAVCLVLGFLIGVWVFGDSVRWAKQLRECEAKLDAR